MIKLKTERIRFEPLKPKYIAELQKLFCNNDLVMKTTLKGRVFDKEEFETLIETGFINEAKDNYGFWCLLSKHDNEVIGVSGLHKLPYLDKESVEFGFILNQNYWGKGLATEIGNFWFKYAEQVMLLPELIATVSPTNSASRRVLEKLEMEYYEEFKSAERGNRLIYKKTF